MCACVRARARVCVYVSVCVFVCVRDTYMLNAQACPCVFVSLSLCLGENLTS